MIKSYVKIHDRLSFETKLEFLTGVQNKKDSEFSVDMFMFVPYNLDINAQNFSKTDFYRALKTNIRFTSPVYDFYKIEEPFQVLVAEIKSLIHQKEFEKRLISHIKRYCSLFRVALRKQIFKAAKIKDVTKQQERIEQIIQQTTKIRKLFSDFAYSKETEANEEIKIVFLRADEYQSLTVEEHFSILISLLEKSKSKPEKALDMLNTALINELNYRYQKKYPSVGTKKIKGYEVLHRKSRLKKYIESNLFLNSETKKDGVLIEQILFSLAAGLAMVFSTAVAFATQKTYGNFTLPFFIALVISYMFKDRIKEMGRIYFDKKQKKVHYDYKTTIYGSNGKKIGNIKERFLIVKKKKVPEEILDMREKMRTTELGGIFQEDSILYYRNKVKIANTENSDYLPSPGLTGILRYNIFDFTLKMDDSSKWYFVKTKEGWKKEQAERLYFINLILRYQINDQIRYEHYKLLAGRSGIRAIKKINLEKKAKKALKKEKRTE